MTVIKERITFIVVAVLITLSHFITLGVAANNDFSYKVNPNLIDPIQQVSIK